MKGKALIKRYRADGVKFYETHIKWICNLLMCMEVIKWVLVSLFGDLIGRGQWEDVMAIRLKAVAVVLEVTREVMGDGRRPFFSHYHCHWYRSGDGLSTTVTHQRCHRQTETLVGDGGCEWRGNGGGGRREEGGDVGCVNCK